MLASFATDGNAVFFGSRGFLITSDTSKAFNGPFSAIEFLEDTTFTSLNSGGSMDPLSDNITTITFAKGTRIYNVNGFVAFRLATGMVLAYKG